MDNFSMIHWLVICFIALMLFGNRLPSVMRSLGEQCWRTKCFWCGEKMSPAELSCRRCKKLRPPPDMLAKQ